MQIKWEKLDLVLGEQNKYRSAIEYAESKCLPLELSCCEIKGRWGIFVRINGVLLLVSDPVELITSVFKEEQIYLRDIDNNAEYQFYIESKFENHVFQWTLKHTSLYQLSGTRYIKLADYLSAVKKVTEQYKEICKTSKPLHNDKSERHELQLKALTLGLEQFEIKSTLPSHAQLMSKDVVIEDFIFEPLGDKWHEQYRIGLGKRTYDTWLTHWDNDFERIRHQLEMTTYNGIGDKAIIGLSNDMSKTTIVFEQKSVLKSVKEMDSGVKYDHDYYMRVEIRADEYSISAPPVMIGYCDIKQSVRALYEGLLKIAMKHPVETNSNDEVPMRLNIYNIFKSPILENFIANKKKEENKPQKRQQNINEIIVIDPDFDLLGYEQISGNNMSVDICNNEVYVADKNYILPNVGNWIREYQKILIVSETGGDTSFFNWNDFHERGLALAYEFRKKLPLNIDLWYQAPFEDKSKKIKPTLIISDIPGEL